MKHIAIAAAVLLTTSCGNVIPDEENIKQRYDYSTDVGHFRVLRTIKMEPDIRSCSFYLWELEAVRMFKGDMKQNDRVLVGGPAQPDYWLPGTERLMFVGDYEGPSRDSCTQYMFENYKAADSCCEITGSGKDTEVHFINMVNSEMRGPDITVPAEKVFRKLDSYE